MSAEGAATEAGCVHCAWHQAAATCAVCGADCGCETDALCHMLAAHSVVVAAAETLADLPGCVHARSCHKQLLSEAHPAMPQRGGLCLCVVMKQQQHSRIFTDFHSPFISFLFSSSVPPSLSLCYRPSLANSQARFPPHASFGYSERRSRALPFPPSSFLTAVFFPSFSLLPNFFPPFFLPSVLTLLGI